MRLGNAKRLIIMAKDKRNSHYISNDNIQILMHYCPCHCPAQIYGLLNGHSYLNQTIIQLPDLSTSTSVAAARPTVKAQFIYQVVIKIATDSNLCKVLLQWPQTRSLVSVGETHKIIFGDFFQRLPFMA